MTKIGEWIKNLPLEYIIFFIILFIIITLLIILIATTRKIRKVIVDKNLILEEDVVIKDDRYILRLNVTNFSYVNQHIKEVGIFYNKTKHPLMEESLILHARDSKELTLKLIELRSKLLKDQEQFKKVEAYVIDSLNVISKVNLKQSKYHINKQVKFEIKKEKESLKLAKKDAKIEAKKIRYETGNYNFGDRIVLFFKLVASPFKKFGNFISTKMNGFYKRREEKKKHRSNNKEDI